jgi:hypothetical protein
VPGSLLPGLWWSRPERLVWNALGAGLNDGWTVGAASRITVVALVEVFIRASVNGPEPIRRRSPSASIPYRAAAGTPPHQVRRLVVKSQLPDRSSQSARRTEMNCIVDRARPDCPAPPQSASRTASSTGLDPIAQLLLSPPRGLHRRPG